jgi:predicted ATPase
MLNKLYVHNYRCLQNFELDVSDINSALIIGRNGSGKSTILAAFEILQKIGRGISPVKELLARKDFAFLDDSKPMEFEINAMMDQKEYAYRLTIDFPANFYHPRAVKEALRVGGKEVFIREGGKTYLHGKTEFTLDWHHVGLPLISTHNELDPIAIFRLWLANILILAPIPGKIASTSKAESAFLERNGKNLVDWLRYHLTTMPALYALMQNQLKLWLPDVDSFRLEVTGREEREFLLRFQDQRQSLELDMVQLSDGEKIYILAAMLLAIINRKHPVLCLWDEPDHFIALPELSHFISACRREFEGSNGRAKLLVTSHNPRVMYEFSGHNSFVISRTSHLHPSRVETLQDKKFLSADAVQAYENGEFC